MMKSFFKKLAFIMALAMVVSLAAPAAQASAAAKKEFTYAYQNGGKVTKLYMNAGEAVDLKFVGVKDYADFAKSAFVWSSFDEDVATVDKNGVITAVANGTTYVQLKIKDSNYTSKAVEVVVGKEIAPVKLGTSKDDLASLDTVYELTIGGAVDLAFFGVPNYNKTNYTVTWVAFEDIEAEELVEATAVQVDKKGVVVAVAEGEADVMALIQNNVTGEYLDAEWVNFKVVAPVEPTEEPTPEVTEAPEEPTAEPTPEVTEAPVASVAVKQTTENDLVLTFTGVDITKLTKEDIEIYEYFEDGDMQEYVWQFYGFANANVEAGTVEIVGYDTDEFVDGAKYVVRYVDVKDEGTAEERSEVIAETTFVASVGEVTDMNVWHASYYHNNGWWQFYDHAYTNASSGEEIQTKVFFALYDENGVDVTGHYQREAGAESLINLELVNEDLDAYVTVDEEYDTIVFSDIPENPSIRFEVVYNDFEADNEVIKVLPMVIEKAPAYTIASIDDWKITLNSNHKLADDNKQDYIALYDDYDQTAQQELMNHELVIWFTDNYGNKYVTCDKFADDVWGSYYWFSPTANGTYYDITTSEKFNGEGFELCYESRNPQVLVVGDDELDEFENSSILTTKKTGTASVNVTLYNALEEEIANRVGVIKITVKPERYVKEVNANSVTTTTDSIAFGATLQYKRTDASYPVVVVHDNADDELVWVPFTADFVVDEDVEITSVYKYNPETGENDIFDYYKIKYVAKESVPQLKRLQYDPVADENDKDTTGKPYITYEVRMEDKDEDGKPDKDENGNEIPDYLELENTEILSGTEITFNANRITTSSNVQVDYNDANRDQAVLYDKRFTTKTVRAEVLDQYGTAWGLHNTSLLDDSLELIAEDTNKDASPVTDGKWDLGWDLAYYHDFDGVKLYKEVGKDPSISYKLTVTDLIHEKEKNATFRVALKYPSENDDNVLQCKSKFRLSAGDATYTNSKLKTTIKVEEISNNGHAVNYVDNVVKDKDGNITKVLGNGNIHLITSATEYSNLFNRKSEPASEGALYLVVYNPKKEIVKTASGSSIGLVEEESGLYTFQIGNAYGGSRCTEFALDGNYVVKLVEVTGLNNDGTVNTFTTTTTKFAITDDRIDIDFDNQKEVYISDETNNWGYHYAVEEGIVGIARYALQYTCNGATVPFERWSNNIDSVSGVRFKENERAKQVVVNDVFIKVMIDVNKNGTTDDDVAFYYVEVPVDKTFTLEEMDLIGNYDTVPNTLDPEGNKMQK